MRRRERRGEIAEEWSRDRVGICRWATFPSPPFFSPPLLFFFFLSHTTFHSSSQRRDPQRLLPEARMLQPLGTRLLARSGASSRIALSVPTGRCLHSTRTPRSTHALDSAVRAERHGAGGARWSAKKRYGTAAGALAFAAVGTAYLTSESTSDIPLLSPNVNPNDPLSALEPSILGRTSAHLTSASMSDLVRQWVVYAVSEQSMLVSAAPWIVEKLQWANDNIPLVGPAVWSIFAFVSPSCFSPSRPELNREPDWQGMENTFYHVFVGGETVPGCAETVKTYAERGVSSPPFGIYRIPLLTSFPSI